MIHGLAQKHASIFGAPVIARADDEIFRLHYFTRCMACDFCRDACCDHGVDVDEPNVKRILARADALERFVGSPRESWFLPGFTDDAEHPGGRYTRTRAVSGRCVFRAASRGCALHAYAIQAGLDYHELKPMVSALFPITFDDGLLHASDELASGELVCGGQGPTVYRGARDEIACYFGEALVRELDELERDFLA